MKVGHHRLIGEVDLMDVLFIGVNGEFHERLLYVFEAVFEDLLDEVEGDPVLLGLFFGGRHKGLLSGVSLALHQGDCLFPYVAFLAAGPYSRMLFALAFAGSVRLVDGLEVDETQSDVLDEVIH
mmetsp:Transcript_31595/g.30906  ORF Transcript_31595/g.30906 Transcript_31595/m.30906 type:complete len:124 (+) Transcript_31595:556-927(+)